MTFTINTDILPRVQRLFGDESGVQLLDTDIVAWVADAFREITTQNPDLKMFYEDIATVAFQQDYTPTQTNVQYIQAVHYREDSSASFYPLKQVSHRQMNEGMPGWNTPNNSYGTPSIYTRSQIDNMGRSIAVYPVPDNANGTIRIHYSQAIEPSVSSDADLNLFIPVAYHNALIEFCLMKAYEMDENWEAADRKAKYFQSTVDSLRFQHSRQDHEAYPVISVLPGDMD